MLEIMHVAVISTTTSDSQEPEGNDEPQAVSQSVTLMTPVISESATSRKQEASDFE